MSEGRLLIRIKHPAWGKGWYKVSHNPAAEGKSDELLIGHIRNMHPQATAIQITREYRV